MKYEKCFTKEELIYLNEPFTKEDLEYIKEMNRIINVFTHYWKI